MLQQVLKVMVLWKLRGKNRPTAPFFVIFYSYASTEGVIFSEWVQCAETSNNKWLRCCDALHVTALQNKFWCDIMFLKFWMGIHDSHRKNDLISGCVLCQSHWWSCYSYSPSSASCHETLNKHARLPQDFKGFCRLYTTPESDSKNSVSNPEQDWGCGKHTATCMKRNVTLCACCVDRLQVLRFKVAERPEWIMKFTCMDTAVFLENMDSLSQL